MKRWQEGNFREYRKKAEEAWAGIVGGGSERPIAEYKPELLFLDIHLPGETGLELLESPGHDPKIIFTTTYSEYAIKSFDYLTVDYLLKPISRERLTQAIDKLTGSISSTSTPSPLLLKRSMMVMKSP